MVKPEEKRTFGSSSHRWGDNINMNISEIGLKKWNGFFLLRELAGFLNAVTNIHFSTKCGELLEYMKIYLLFKKDSFLCR
jgi:hypothetical protein